MEQISRYIWYAALDKIWQKLKNYDLYSINNPEFQSYL